MEKKAGKELLLHFSHIQHPLILKRLPKQYNGGHYDNHHVNSRLLEDHRCDGCRERISLYGEPYCYRCNRGCDYDLHKRCAEAPLSIQHHPLHQQHPLQLLEKPPNDECTTDCCKRPDWKNFTYHCSTCKFNIDIICATTGERKEFIRHFSHIQHPLFLNKLPKIRHHYDKHHVNRELLDSYCRGCENEISSYGDPYCYRCDKCKYTLHKSCAEAPLSIQHHPLHQNHPLRLLEKPPYNIYITECCQRDFWGAFTYHCSTCKFNIDIICATAGERKELQHFSHKEHPLVLKKLPQIITPNKQDHHVAIYNIGDGEGVNYPGLLDEKCNGCFEEISLYDEPYCYRCDRGCYYHLHKLCAEAPLTMRDHPLHPKHPLQLLKEPPYECTTDCCKLLGIYPPV